MTDTLTLDQVVRKNSIERLKKEKHPLDVLEDLPELIAKGYEAVSEEDVVRLMWYGLYHDKPKTGFFMLRVKVPSGILSPERLRTIGRLSVRFGRGFGELSTRQNIQLHWIRLDHLPEVLETLDRSGLNVRGGCGDTVRNITGCPVAGLDGEELFDARPIVEEAARFFYGNREYCDLPRKHKITISACRHQCNAPDINCIALVGALKEGRPGFAIRVGGGLSTVPRLSRDLGVFVPVEECLPVLRGVIDVWKDSLKYRLSRVKARLKFMVDDVGAEGYRRLVEERLGRPLEDGTAPAPETESEHVDVHRQKQPGLAYVGFPVPQGLVSGEQMLRIAEVAESSGGDVRLTRQQNFILTGIPEDRVAQVVEGVAAIGFRLDVNRIRASSVACTGQPLCNYAVAQTKPKLAEILDRLEARFGKDVEGLRVNVDGCPHACCHHWVSDIGLQGTTLRERGPDGEKLQGYEIYLRGGLGLDSAIGRPIVRRVPADKAPLYVERLVEAYLTGRHEGERFKPFADRHADEELIAIAAGERKANGAGGAATDRRPVTASAGAAAGGEEGAPR
jgi:ferredoxin-nitrite reductase